MRLNAKTYTLKQARNHIEVINSMIVLKSEQYVTLKVTLDNLQKSIGVQAEKKAYIKSILNKNTKLLRNLNLKKRLGDY